VAERSDLDRWILAELDLTVKDVRSALDGYLSHVAARRIEALVESISNWYVRRSRARFWSEGENADKSDAFATLYETLVELAKLIAPFVPFLAEALYRNLVLRVDAGAAPSVHLTDYPAPDPARSDVPLCATMDTIRQIVALGQRVRAERKLKVRQPLGEAIIAVANETERAQLERFTAIIGEELNVRRIEFTSDPQKYVEFQLVPNFRVLGKRLGNDMPACKRLLTEADGSKLHADLARDGSITLALPGGPVQLGPEDIEIRLKGKADYAAASAGGHVIVLDVRIDEGLRREGLAREVVNRLQRARKSMALAYEQRIAVRYAAAGELAEAIRENADSIARETLAVELVPGSAAAGDGADVQQVEVEGEPLTLWISPRDK
jgi:isoleucyl-tRNA synthetase